VLSVLRNGGGTFLAFVPPDTKIPPGQLVRLNTPAGAKLKGRLFLVPIRPTVALVPLDTVTLVATRIEDFGPRLAITLVGTPAPHLTVVFDVLDLPRFGGHPMVKGADAPEGSPRCQRVDHRTHGNSESKRSAWPGNPGSRERALRKTLGSRSSLSTLG